MLTRNSFLLIASCLTLGACAAAPGGNDTSQADMMRGVPKARAVAETERCIPIRQIRESKVHNDYVIDFEMAGGKVYRNTLPRGCPGLGFEEAFSYKTSLSQLCSTDIISVVRTVGGQVDTGTSCGLGQFQPVELTGDK